MTAGLNLLKMHSKTLWWSPSNRPGNAHKAGASLRLLLRIKFNDEMLFNGNHNLLTSGQSKNLC